MWRSAQETELGGRRFESNRGQASNFSACPVWRDLSQRPQVDKDV